MQQYFDGQDHPLEKQLIRAAHYLATEWEFRIIDRMNQGIFWGGGNQGPDPR
jgi:putative hydrolases of HD superfamily